MNSLKNISKKIFTEIEDLLLSPKKIVVTTHKNPDGDAIGSALGLCRYLTNQGHNAVVVTPNEYPDFLQWLPYNENVIHHNKNKQKALALFTDCDLAFCLDFNDTSRLEKMEEDFLKRSCKTIMIDHHPHPSCFADYMISETKVSSTAELIFDFICNIHGEKFLDKAVGECLFTGIMTDTGSFSYSSSNPNTFRVVYELLKLGIDKDNVHFMVYNNYSESRMRLLGYCLNDKMIVLNEYKTAYIYLSKEELKRFNFTMGDEEGLVNYPLSIKGIRISAIFVEKNDQVKISFRSRGTFPVNKLAHTHFEGGGHTNAAGGKSELSLNDTIEKFLNLLPQYTNELD